MYVFGVRPVFGDIPFLTPPVEDALERSVSFWRETPPTEELSTSPLIAEHGFSPDTRLDDRLDAETKRRFDAVAHAAGVDPETLQTFRPWLALQVLRHATYEPIWSGPTMDEALTEIAIRHGMTINYEFDVEGIVRAFADLSPDAEIELLRFELGDLEPGAAHIVDRYRRAMGGDLSFEEAEAHRVSDTLPQFYGRLLVERNRAWIPRIDDALAKGETTFIAVGTMHLVGPDNVRTLLDDRIRQIA